MSRIAIALVHGHAAKWLQVAMYSLQNNPNQIGYDIFVAVTWPDHPSLKAITENDLCKNVTFIPCTIRLHSHATGLDQILDHIADKDEYDYMFAMEDDCRICRPIWLDWYLSFMKDESIGMAGFFWHEGANHFNINPSATLYRKSMLLKYHKEARENDEGMFWHPRGNRPDTDGGMDPTIKDVAGVFSETRGIKDPSPQQKDVILKGVPQAAWYEPGAWLYCRSVGEYGGVAVPCDHLYMSYKGKIGVHTAPEATYYGGKADPYVTHYWGGTRAWDHLKHPVSDLFVKNCSPLWLDREDVIWRQTVPEHYRGIMDEVYKEMGLEGMGYDNRTD